MKRRGFFKLLAAGASFAVYHVKETAIKWGILKKGQKFTITEKTFVNPVINTFDKDGNKITIH